jgi:peptidoglycan hydrolase-like protein with peptidoglycan-binding domain
MNRNIRTSFRTWVARAAVLVAVVGSLQVAAVVAEEATWLGSDPGAVSAIPDDQHGGIVGASTDITSVEGDASTVQADDADLDARQRDAEAAQAERQRRTAALQDRLSQLGWYVGVIDGVPGPGTEQALRDFQRAAGLAVDGIAGPQTEAALTATDAVTRAQWEQQEEARPSPTTSPTPTATPSPSPTTSPSPTPTRSAEPAPVPTETCDVPCRGQRALDITPLVAPPGWTITFEPGRDGYLGMAYGGSRKEIVIWIRDSHTDRQVAATLLHEMGHAWDFEGLGGHGDTARERWASMRGFAWAGRDRWFGMDCLGCYGFAIGAEDFAESVTACLAPGWDGFRSAMAGPPTSAQCDYLRNIVG